MQLVDFGQSGLSVSRIGLGLAALGRPGYINLGHANDLASNYEVAAMQARTSDMLELAYQLGVRYFDTARSYGKGEAFLGEWLRAKGLPYEAMVIGSKWGYTYTADWQIDVVHHEVKDHSLPVLNRQWQESQEILGEHLDIYHIHSATLESGALDNEGLLPRLFELKEKGLIIGLSLSGAGQGPTLLKALEIQRDGAHLFGSVQATWNLLEQSVGEALKAAHEAGWGVIIKEALANGRLTSRNDHPDFQAQMALLKQISAELGTTIDALAMAYVLAQPWVDVVLSGAAQEAHLRSNLAALEVEIPQEVQKRLSELCEEPKAYWQIRKSLAWN